ncbi:thiol-disulfide oxidoreductase DCC family protein [Halosimplex salinum]|uniref:hypothetical protein n=1 Tax=Halosimplex salinum TaxID=1710538 RepID=UPI0013DDA387|nr:hypothetical protein [Halosimplex salinum]
MAANANQTNDTEATSSNGTVVYDGQCQVCRHLAFKLQDGSDGAIDILPLESQEAGRMLRQFYPDGPEHDFYYVEDGSCSKGVRAIPRIARAAGVREFGGLVKEYALLKHQSEQSGDCGCGDDHETESATATDSGENSISRRAFTGAMSAAAATLMTGTALGAEPTSSYAPRNLEVRVATVTPDGNGGFETEVRRRQDLIHSADPLEGKSSDTDTETALEKVSSDTTELAAGTVGSSGELKVDKVTSTIDISGVDSRLQEAASLQGDGDGSLMQKAVYTGSVDHRRFDMSVNAGRGPVVTEAGETAIQTTMAGEIHHDVAVPSIDYVVFDVEEAPVTDHFDAYVAGVERLREIHDDGGNGELAGVYADIEAGLRETRGQFAESVAEDDLVAVSNHVGLSGIPGFHQYALPPAEAQSDVSMGADCGAECSCSIDICCGCGISAGICTTPIKFCGCCVAQCGCGVECCTNL